MIKWDGHTHTKFCKHGYSDELALYLDRAVALGFERYSVTEHSPIPDRWVDDAVLMAELAMGLEELPAYFADVAAHQARYEGTLEVAAGLEIDYLHEYESFTASFVSEWAHVLDDCIVSVHYLPGRGGMRCVDYKPDDFRVHLLDYYGSMERVVDTYFDHVEQAIDVASRMPGRRRIGHIGLIRKFRDALPPIDHAQVEERMAKLLPLLAQQRVGLDINTAGLRVATCREVYVPQWVIEKAVALGIPCVFGSDAHKAEHVGADWTYYEQAMQAAEHAKPSA